ncbi:MAG TPA: V-type ATP synthase subunit F [Syntrophales bacterium]|mgnify:CR=1 FL=1|nr:V-type ATP synthase subunit F [Syntrophales bacterium]
MRGMDDFQIAVIGNRDETNLLRLTGVRKYVLFDEEDRGLPEKLRTALDDLAKDPSVGLVLVPDAWVEHVRDKMKKIRSEKRAKTVIIEYPARYREEERDIRQYYKALTRSLIGFNVEI